MRVVIQRVSKSSVEISGKIHSSIQKGLVVLVGIVESDTKEDIEWLTRKILNLRIFSDEKGIMNNSLLDNDGELLVISQFTLQASTKKGNRPSYIAAAKPEIAIPIYEQFVSSLQQSMQKNVKTGVFGADMKISLINDGPVTIVIDSKLKV